MRINLTIKYIYNNNVADIGQTRICAAEMAVRYAALCRKVAYMFVIVIR